MPRTRVVVAVVLAAVMVLSAGCAGFGTDGPAGPSEVSDGGADDQENESSINDTESTNESSEEFNEDSNEYNETDPPESSDEDGPDKSPAAGGSDDGSADETEGTDSTSDAEEGGDAGSGTNSDQEDASSSDDAPSENGGEDSPESGDEDADGGDGSNEADDGESGEEPQVYTLTVEADSPVTLERTWEDASTTREPTDGTVEFSVIEGSYTLSADGYYDVPEEMAIQVDSDTTVTMQSEDGGEIEVDVVDAETGEPIKGAEISGVCDWYYSSGDAHITGETDADGVANAHAELAPTDCDATVSAEGYESESVALSVPDDDGLTVELEPEESGMSE